MALVATVPRWSWRFYFDTPLAPGTAHYSGDTARHAPVWTTFGAAGHCSGVQQVLFLANACTFVQLVGFARVAHCGPSAKACLAPHTTNKVFFLFFFTGTRPLASCPPSLFSLLVCLVLACYSTYGCPSLAFAKLRLPMAPCAAIQRRSVPPVTLSHSMQSHPKSQPLPKPPSAAPPPDLPNPTTTAILFLLATTPPLLTPPPSRRPTVSHQHSTLAESHRRPSTFILGASHHISQRHRPTLPSPLPGHLRVDLMC